MLGSELQSYAPATKILGSPALVLIKAQEKITSIPLRGLLPIQQKQFYLCFAFCMSHELNL